MPKHTLGLMLTAILLGLVFVLPGRLTFAPSEVPSFLRSTVAPHTPDPNLIDQIPCWFEVPTHWPTTECGILHVPEDHFEPGPKTVRLPFVIFRSAAGERGDAPVVVTGGGGPGGPLRIGRDADLPIDQSLWAPFSRMSVFGGRDLILIDNRGVGSSVPRLDCPEIKNAFLNLTAVGATESEELVAIQSEFAACRKRLTETEGVDLSKYNVVQAAYDLDALRRGLGADSLNLYGVSYGTRVAMVYAREFPTTTRAMVLDSVVPLHIKLLEESPKLGAGVFMRVFEMCTEDQRCRARFGSDLLPRFEAFLENLDGGSLELTITNPQTLEPLQLKVGSAAIVWSLYYSMYAGPEIQKIPLTVYTLMNGSFDYLGEVVREGYVKTHTVRSIDEGAFASYSCFDEIPFNDGDLALAEVDKYPVQNFMNRLSIKAGLAMCEVWDVPAGGPVEAEPVRSSAPTLFLSGDLDPVTPSAWAADALRYFPRAYHIVWPNVGHGVMLANACADEVARVFLDHPRQDPTAESCIDYPPPFRFFLD